MALTHFSDASQKLVEQQSMTIETKNTLRSVQGENKSLDSSLKETTQKADELQTENESLKVKLQAKKDAAALAAQVAVKPIVAAPVVSISGDKNSWLANSGISQSDWGYVDYIISHESSWNPTRYNTAGSGAYGLGQALPASKMAAYGADYMTNPTTQLIWANAYAIGRYGSWSAAYNFWVANHYW